MRRTQAEHAAWIAGAVGLVGTAIGWFVSPATFPHAWLAAFTTWLGWPLGCMGLLLVHALTGGDWGEVTRPQLIGGMFTLALLPPAIVPLIFFLPSLYPWARPEIAAHLHNRFYLNFPSLVGRTVAYVVIWFGLWMMILKALRHANPQAMLGRIAPVGLILLALTVTFAEVDSIMALDPHFVSSVFGLVAIAEMGLLALSVSVFAAVVPKRLHEKAVGDLGRLLLALLILWAYLDFMQLLIIWQSDLPNEAPWYTVRLEDGWGYAAAAITGGHFALPFLALLSPKLQRSRPWIAFVSALLILSGIVYGWWLIVPASGQGFAIFHVFAMLGMIGIAAAVALRAPLLPVVSQTAQRHA